MLPIFLFAVSQFWGLEKYLMLVFLECIVFPVHVVFLSIEVVRSAITPAGCVRYGIEWGSSSTKHMKRR